MRAMAKRHRERPPYDPNEAIWWGINEDGTPDEAKLQAIVEAFVAEVDPERIVLFGSAARGTMDYDSDLDLLVVVESDEPRWKTTDRLRELRPRRSAAIDIIVANPKDVAETEDDPLFVTHDAKREGRVLYDAKRKTEKQR